MYRILYVDDEPGLLEIGKLFLEGSGQFSVDTITSAPAALALLNTNTYDAVISDYQMPEMDGIGFLKKVRTSGNTIPFILFTGRGREEVVIQAINEGADFYLQKGGEPRSQFAELSHKIRQAIQKRLAEGLLRESEEQLSTIFRAAQVGIVVVDAGSHTILQANPRAQELIGASEREITGNICHRFICPAEQGACPVTDLGQAVNNSERVLLTKDGSRVPIIKTVVPTQIGNRTMLVESFIDITERKSAELALQESEQKFATVFFKSPAILTISTLDEGRFVEVNDAAVRVSGLSREEIIGKTSKELGTFVNYADRDTIARTVSSGGKIQDLEVQLRNRTGGIRTFLFSGERISVRNCEYLLLQGIDITERKQIETELVATYEQLAGAEEELRAQYDRLKLNQQATQESEERYRNVVEDQTEFISRFLPDGTHVFVNEAYCRSFGLKRNGILGHRFRPEIPAGDRERVRQFFGSLTPEHPVDSIEHRIIMPDGSIRWQRWTDRAIFGPSGTVCEYQSVGGDITERKETEITLQESEAKYRTVIEQSHDGIIIAQDELLVFHNPSFAAMTGYPGAELAGRPIAGLIAPEDREMVLTRHRERLRGKTVPVVYEFSVLHRNGGRIRVSMNVSSATFHGRPATIGTLHNVTEERKREEALRESEERFRKIFENSPLGMTLVTPEFRFFSVNPAWVAMTGYSEEELLAMSFTDITHPDHLAVDLEQLRELVAGTIPLYSAEKRYVRKDGSTLWGLVRVSTIRDLQGNLRYFAAQIADVSERKKAEEALKQDAAQLRQIIDLVPHMIFAKDWDGNYLLANRAVAEGYDTTVSGIVGKSQALFHKDTDELRHMLEDDREVMATGTAKFIPEEPYIDASGKRRYLQTTKVPFTTPGNNQKAVLGVAIDITERTAAETALREANRKLNILNNITRHDIRNTLFGLDVYLLELRKSVTDPKLRDYIGRSIDAVKAVTHQIEFTREYQSLGAQTAQWQEIGPLLPHKPAVGIRVAPEIARLEIFADPMLRKVFHNLYDNALRHGERVTEIRIHCDRTPGGLTLVWEDDGAGIPAEEKERIFERGFGKHTGLGLFLVREILGITGIAVQETGAPGHGARFEMIVPEDRYRIRGEED